MTAAPPPEALALQQELGFDDATRDRLVAYVALLLKWQGAINLIGPGTVVDVWSRHIRDCAQLKALIPDRVGSICDLGSGGGLPGVVLAILGVAPMTLVESDRRKATFLSQVNRALALNLIVEARRAEDLEPQSFDLITARALAPLGKLLSFAQPLLKTGGQCLFLKGRTAEQELTEANENWKMTVTRLSSQSDPDGVILQLKDIQPRHG